MATDLPLPLSPARPWGWARRSPTADRRGPHRGRARPQPGCLRAARAELGDEFEPVTGDVGDWDAHQRAADFAEERGQLRHWVNNAGIDIVGGAHEVTPEHIDRRPEGAAAWGDVRLRHRRAQDAPRPPRVDREHLLHPGRRRLAAILRLRRRQGGDPDGHQERRSGLRPVRAALQRRASRQHRHADVPGRDSGRPGRSEAWLEGEAALAPMQRIGEPPRYPKWWPSCSPTGPHS